MWVGLSGDIFLEGSSSQARLQKTGFHRMLVVNKSRGTAMIGYRVFRRQWVAQLFQRKAWFSVLWRKDAVFCSQGACGLTGGRNMQK